MCTWRRYPYISGHLFSGNVNRINATVSSCSTSFTPELYRLAVVANYDIIDRFAISVAVHGFVTRHGANHGIIQSKIRIQVVADDVIKSFVAIVLILWLGGQRTVGDSITM